jgi:uncharacterized protein
LRVAVVADTHLPRGRRRLPRECVARLRRADLILHAGDFVTLDVLRELQQIAPVAGVHGNNDDAALVEQLPARRVVTAGGLRIGMLHAPGRARGRAERLAAAFPGCEAVVYAHTHVPQIVRHGRLWLLNPGSPTERRRAPTRAMLDVEVESGAIAPRLVEFP